jgi:rSAM/selenodomain-associated transferase 1
MRLFGLFAKQPVAGTVKTRLAETLGVDGAAELSAAFLHDLTERFAAMGDERWLGYAPATSVARDWFEGLSAGRFALWPQPAGDLGARIEAFFAAALNAGDSGPESMRAVLIGSDSPTLPVDLVQQAFAALETSDAVLGPAVDGGYYLIGLRRMPAGLLNGVRWSSPHALADTVACLQRAEMSLAGLPPWYDIDTAEDLSLLQGHFAALRHADPSRSWSATERWMAQHVVGTSSVG